MTIEAQLTETNKLLGDIRDLLAIAKAAPQPTKAAEPEKAASPAKVTKGTKPAPAATPPVDPPKPEENFDFDAPPADEAKKLTVDDARKALVALQKAKGSAEASRGVLKANGLDSLASLGDNDQAKIKAVIDGCAAKL